MLNLKVSDSVYSSLCPGGKKRGAHENEERNSGLRSVRGKCLQSVRRMEFEP